MGEGLIYVVILNYNGWEDTIECLESVTKTVGVQFCIVVVDNNSSDNSFQKIISWANGEIIAKTSSHSVISSLVQPSIHKPVKFACFEESDISTREYPIGSDSIILIKSESNRGFSAGNNIGIKYALGDSNCEYIWLLNNDTVVFPDTLARLVNFHKEESKASKLGILGNRLLHYYEPSLQQVYAGKYDKWTGSVVHVGENEPAGPYVYNGDFDYAIGASLFVSTPYIKDVGILDEGYFLYFEELDWTLRGKEKGWVTKIDSNTALFHKHGSSTGNNNVSERSVFSDVTIVRSRMRFVKKHYPWMSAIMVFTFPIVVLNRIRRGQISRVPRMLKALVVGIFSKI